MQVNYKCPEDGFKWSIEADCAHDDQCPKCGKDITAIEPKIKVNSALYTAAIRVVTGHLKQNFKGCEYYEGLEFDAIEELKQAIEREGKPDARTP